MSSVKDNIQKKIIEAMKNKDKETVDTLRFLMAKIKIFEIDKIAKEKKEITNEDVFNLIRKLIKELNESITAFEKGNRQDLKNQSLRQKQILSQFLPPELTDEEIEKEIKKIINANLSLYQQNKKAIVGIVMKQLRGKAESQRILKNLQKFLTQ